ncbi:glycosyltransferase family 4 protein [Candidatus Woesearchaeota archaeon]|nr:glycosyltransferase family 4 protein [Candidatus Woesearchaeota archaeon]
MTKQKLLIAADTYFPKKDGVVRFLKELVPRLSKDFNITLLVPNFEKNKIEIKKGKTTVVKLPVSKFIGIAGYQAVKYSLQNRKAIKKYVRETDFVFAQDLAPIGSWSIRLAKKFKKPVLAYIHQINWEQLPPMLPKLFRSLAEIITKRKSLKLYNQCDLILVPYKNLGQELKEKGIAAKTEVVRLGINTKVFKPSENKEKSREKIGLHHNRAVIGYVGRLSEEKNVNTLLETFKRLQEKYKIYLLIVGDGSIRTKKGFEEIPYTKITGFVSQVVPYLQAMDIFVMPSLTETTSLATLEAMACGVPVITTKVGFLQEYVIKNHNGLLFPKGNPYNLQIQLKKLLDHPELREKFGKNARAVAQSFSWDKTASDIKRIINKI